MSLKTTVFACALLVLTASAARADYWIANPTIPVGGLTQLELNTDSFDGGPDHIGFTIQYPAAELQVFEVVRGAAIDAYLADWGAPPSCDIVIYPGEIAVLMVLPGFDPTIYGTEFIKLSCAPTSPTPTSFDVNLSEFEHPEVVYTMPITVGESQSEFRRGDVNSDGACNVSDPVRLLEHLFVPGSDPLECADTSDIDDNGAIEVTDAVLLLSGLFAGGEMPDDGCHADGSADALPTCVYAGCP